MSMSDPNFEVHQKEDHIVRQQTSSHNMVNGNRKRLSADLPEEPPAPEEEEINLSQYTDEKEDSIIKEDD